MEWVNVLSRIGTGFVWKYDTFIYRTFFRIRSAAGVMQSLYRSVVVKRELSCRQNTLFASQSLSFFTYPSDWNNKVASEVVEMRSFYRDTALVFHDRMRSLAIWESIRIELLLWIERSQLRLFGNIKKMPHGWFPLELYEACPTARRTWGKLGPV